MLTGLETCVEAGHLRTNAVNGTRSKLTLELFFARTFTLATVCATVFLVAYLSGSGSNQNEPQSAVPAASGGATTDTELFASFLCNFKRAMRVPNLGAVYDGYVILTQLGKHWTDLVQTRTGLVKHRWFFKHPASKSAVLLENGNLLYMGHWSPSEEKEYAFNESPDAAGILRELNWDSEVMKSCTFSNNTHILHHDFVVLPNGNYLALAWRKVTLEDMEARGFSQKSIMYSRYKTFNKGHAREQTEYLVDGVVELKSVPEKEECQTVWYWWEDDHLIQDLDPNGANYGVVKNNPQLIDVHRKDEMVAAESAHMNALDYDPLFDQVLLNSMCNAESYIIDHNTTIDEAASHKGGARGKGGDILFRWGNDQIFQGQRAKNNGHTHGARFIPRGHNLTGAGEMPSYTSPLDLDLAPTH
ncbi:hypothetical protein CYMTET_50064 [Cymbomonas tetramitiformis]|uniref:Uncharacterized protein n=1 Tax=Cymbomonas tetramitiformis TaxID=36881 RepID=A0AAE0BQU9_9CHLO|nr:hypothetical protein CYMTET_50064 [Cymbomonas tetramitiformis]